MHPRRVVKFTLKGRPMLTRDELDVMSSRPQRARELKRPHLKPAVEIRRTEIAHHHNPQALQSACLRDWH